MSQSIDIIRRNFGVTGNAVGQLFTAIEQVQDKLKGTSQAGAAFVSLESHSESSRPLIADLHTSVQTALESVAEKLGLAGKKDAEGNRIAPFTVAQEQAALYGAMLGAQWKKGLGMSQNQTGLPNSVSMEHVRDFHSFGMTDRVEKRSYGLEAYLEQDNRSALTFTVTYNIQAARQDDWGETLYPTITMPSDQAGVAIVANLFNIQDNVERSVNGAAYELGRINLIRAVADPTVLRKEDTRAVPVYRVQSANKFVSTSILPVRQINLEGEVFETSGLKIGEEVDLLGLSQTDAMVRRGVQNQTDTLEAAASIENLYIKFGDDVLRVRIQDLPHANFVPALQGDGKLEQLAFDTTSVMLNEKTLTATGGALVSLADVKTKDLVIRMRVAVNGNLRIDTGNAVVYKNKVAVSSIRGKDGKIIPLTDSSIASLVTLLNSGDIVAWDPLAYRSNANRRQEGQFIDVAKQYQRYLVPLRSPITARHPAHVDGAIDTSDVQALITATRIRISNESVTALLQAADILSQYCDSRDDSRDGPDVLGVGRFYVRPVFDSREFDALKVVDSRSSHERALDIQAGIVNLVRDVVYNLNYKSEFKAGADALYGGVAPAPEVILATDPVTARYIMVPGDIRTLGNEFKLRVVSTLDNRVKDKIFITFGIFDGDRNTNINPLNFGNLLWAPELVLTANISRAGQFSRETLVQPRYLFINNLPIMGVITVKNIREALNKLPLFVEDVTPVTP